MWKCKFCDKELEVLNKYSKSGHLSGCKKFKVYKEEVLTKEYFLEEYVRETKSALEIAKQNGLESASTVIRLLKKYGISTRSIKESKNDREKSKRYSTNLKRYGESHNFNKKHPSRLKWEKEMFEEEGIVNVFQRKSIVESAGKKSLETKYSKGIAVRPEDQKDFKVYKRLVRLLTDINYNKNLKLLNPTNLERTFRGFHLDHIISLQHGFTNNIPIGILAHPANLQLIPMEKNFSKGNECGFTIESLLERIHNYEN